MYTVRVGRVDINIRWESIIYFGQSVNQVRRQMGVGPHGIFLDVFMS